MEIHNISELAKGQNIIRKERNKENPYAQIYKGLINDRSISYKALGLVTYISSKPNDWQVYISELERKDIDAEKSVRAGLKELMKAGYMQRYPIYVNGLVYCWRTILNETPYEKEEIIKNIKLITDDFGNVIKEEITYKNNENLLPQNGQPVENTLLAENLQVDNLQVENEGLLINNLTNNDLTNNYDVVVEAFSKAKDKSPTKAEKEKLIELSNTYSEGLILKAIDMTVEQAEHFNIKYIRTILESFKAKGLNTLQEVETWLENDKRAVKKGIENQRENLKNIKVTKDGHLIKDNPSNSFMNRKQATYDIADIERKLLGWQ